MLTRVGLASCALAWFAACGGSPGPSPASSGGVVSEAPVDAAMAPAASEPAAFQQPQIPTGGDPAQHFLADTVVLTMQTPYVRNHSFGHAATVLRPPAPPDVNATLWNFSKKAQLETRHYWKTRAAKVDELVPGMLVAAVWKRDRGGILAPPQNADEAYQGLWAVARVVSIRSREEGYVLLAGGLLAPPATLRVLEGDDSPKLARQGVEDVHFLGEEHMFVGKQPLPSRRHMFVHPALPTNPDVPLSDGGQGRFLQVSDGEVVRTAHAWRTRVATVKELKPGMYVFAPRLKEGSVHRAPRTRNESLGSLWFVVKLESLKGRRSDTVLAEGNLEIDVKALRVLVQ